MTIYALLFLKFDYQFQMNFLKFVLLMENQKAFPTFMLGSTHYE